MAGVFRWLIAIAANALGLVGLYCFLIIFGFRVDDAEEFDFKRHAAFGFIFIWPAVFFLVQIVINDDKRSCIRNRCGKWVGLLLETFLVLLICWFIAVFLMSFEYQRLTNPEGLRGSLGI